MEKADVIRLFMVITDEYPNFDDSDENVDRHLKALKDFSFETAVQNVQRHIETNSFYPKISEIRGFAADQATRERELEATRAYLDQREANRAKATLPPAGWKDGLLAKLRNTRD
ncbi:replicative helicase loader/inhibitor [Paenibacillus sp. O199]|uniref:replicative helicase loader/inhibitor n=1 Tax=Paenibacillus sp. O199 TaxID=1643925 RepID=UPI0007BFAC90|nr:replicative helicase loader/inhibitor [Paenibacillus sp. O199]